MNIKNINNFSFILGLFAADGNLDKYRVRFFCSEEEIEYFREIVVPMMIELFNYKSTIRHDIKRNYVISLNSKKIENFFRDIFPYKGKKHKNMELPKCKFNSTYFIAGLIAGDGSLVVSRNNTRRNKYPQLSFVNASKILIDYFCEYLRKNDISFYKYTGTNHYRLMIKGGELYKLLKFMPLVNKVQLSKLKVLMKIGHLPPYTTYKARLEILNMRR